jgi:hypothetical protein
MPSPALNLSLGLRRNLHWFGSALAIGGIVFVGIRLCSYAAELDFSRFSLADYALIGALAATYGAANLFLALAWCRCLAQLGATERRIGAIKIYGMSQLAKYVPGNIFHLAGRQAMGMAAGYRPKVLAQSMAWELGSIALAGALFGWLVLPRLLPALTLPFALLLMCVSCVVIAMACRRWVGRHAAAALSWQLCFLTVSAAVFVVLLELLTGFQFLGFQRWLLAGGAYTFAWLVGLVTPGAPAGVGVRELILLMVLDGIAADHVLLMAVLFGRVVTVIGDFLFFVTASLISDSDSRLDNQHA